MKLTIVATLLLVVCAFFLTGQTSEPEKTVVSDIIPQKITHNEIDDKKSLQTQKHNALRVLYQRKYEGDIGIGKQEKTLIEKFAKKEGLDLIWIEIKNQWELLPAIFEGKGDIIVAQSYEIAGGLEGIVSFTEPWDISSQQLVTRGYRNPIKSIKSLRHREIAIKKSSLAWNSIVELRKLEATIDIHIIDEKQSETEILNKTRSGVYDIAVFDSDYLDNLDSEFYGLNTIYQLPKTNLKVWSVKKQNAQLKKKLDDFLNKELLASIENKQNFFDFSELKERGVLRLISFNSPSTVFYANGELKGLEYELMKSFAENHHLELNVVLAQSHEELFDLLKEGKGDVISASIPDSKNISDDFTRSNAYLFSSPTIIGRKNSPALIDFTDLDNRTIAISSDSPYLNLLNQIKEKNLSNFNIKLVDSQINTETLLFMVSLGVYDLTLIPSHTVKSELKRQINLKALMKMAEPDSLVWITRNSDNNLMNELNKFIDSNYRQTVFNTIRDKYIKNPISSFGDTKLISKAFELTPYDKTIIDLAEKYGFDWRLIAAQMYQESQFDPKAKSNAGAEGLMQIMPRTALELGLENINDPIKNIDAGIRYLHQLRERFEGDILLSDKNWMALAAYNAGFRRISQARKYAETLGLDKNKWFENVEVAMKKMARLRSETDKRICRCGQTVLYVRDIKTRYNNYIGITESTQLASLN